MLTNQVIIGPEEAKKLLETCPEFQRNLSSAKVDQFAREMQAGMWMPDMPLHISNGLLVDGQHRLQAVIKSGAHISFVIINHNGSESARDRYMVIDQHLPRAFGAIAKVDDREWKITNTDKNIMSGAMFIMANNFLRSRGVILSNAEKLEMMFGWQGEFLQYKEILSLQANSLFTASPYVSVALVTLRAQNSKATDFWYHVITGETDSKENPYAALRRFIVDRNNRNVGSGAQKHRLSAAINCWNHFYRGETIKQLKFPDLSGIKIAGTAF